MSQSDELRIERLRRLHGKFLDSANEHPTLFHVACRSDQERLWTIMSPSWLLDGSKERSLILPGAIYPSPLQGLSKNDVHKKLHQWFWSDAVQFGGSDSLLYNAFVGPAKLVTIYAQEWMGRYVNPAFDDAESGTPDVGYGPYDPCITEFEQLSQEATYHFANPDSPPMRVSEAFNEEIKGRNPWLEIVYRHFSVEPEQWEYDPSFPFPLEPNESFFVTGLPCPVFLASARVLEMLIDRRLTVPSDTTVKSNLNEAEERIIDVIRAAGRRLKTEEIVGELENLFGAASEGTTKTYLAGLVRRGLLTNRQDVTPKG